MAFLAAVSGCTGTPPPARTVPATARPIRHAAAHSDTAQRPAHHLPARAAPLPVAPAKEPVAASVHPRRAPVLPAIYSVHATPGIVHGGDKVRWDIRTSPDVVSVAAHVSAVTLPMYRLSSGHFGLTFSVPNGVPFFFHGVYTCDVRALTASGETLHRDIELTFQ